MARALSLIAIAVLTACSSSGGPAAPVSPRAPVVTASAPANTSSQTRATFVIHWPSAAQAAAAARRRQTISPSTQSISVTVNGSSPTVVNKPALAGSPSTTSVSIVAPPGNDGFTFTAWDELDATGNVLDQSTVNQQIVANATNTVAVALDGVCAALVPSLSGTPTFITYQNASVPLLSSSLTVLKSARLIGPAGKTVTFSRVDADGNAILSSAGVAPISVQESGTTSHVSILPQQSGVSNQSFTIYPIVAEPDGFSTTITATSANCGSGTAQLPNSFAVSTSAEIVVADSSLGLFAYDQDGNEVAQLSKTTGFTGVAYNANSNVLLAIASESSSGGVSFQEVTPQGSLLASSSFTPSSCGGFGAQEVPANIAYDAADSNYYFALRALNAENEQLGPIEEYSFSGATAIFDACGEIEADPSRIAVIGAGNLVVNDYGGEPIPQFEGQTSPPALDVGSYSNLNTVGPSTGTAGPDTCLSFDSSRGYIIGLNSASTSGTIYNQVLSELGTFAYPSGTYAASVYSAGNDELYLFTAGAGFAAGGSVGLSGSTVSSGGSLTSNLSGSAFANLVAPTQAIAIP